MGQETTDVIAAESKAHLCEVIGTETEKICYSGHLTGLQRRPRYFDHCTIVIGDLPDT